MSLKKGLFYGAFILFIGLMISQIWDDISFIIRLHSTIHTKDFGEIPAVISEDRSIYKPYGVVFLKLIILVATLTFMFKKNKGSFIVFNSIMIPFLCGWFFLILKNKFLGYDFNTMQLILIGSMISIYLVLPFSQIGKITLNIKDLCFTIFGILISITSYLIVFTEI
jgi:hypothetical protein